MYTKPQLCTFIYTAATYVHTYIPMYIHTHVHTCIHTSDRSYLHKCSCSRTFIVSIFLKDPIGCHVIIEQFMSVLFGGLSRGDDAVAYVKLLEFESWRQQIGPRAKCISSLHM
jgi:hypothetical protein